MSWVLLMIASVLEVCATTAFRLTEGFTKFWPTVAFAVTTAASMLTLQASLSGIPLGTAYAVWTGLGAAGTAVLGFWIFDEPATTWRLLFLFLLISSVIGLKFVSAN